MNNMIYNIRQPIYQQQQQLGNGEQTMKQNNGHSLAEKIIIGLDHAPPAFNLREQLTGIGGANLQYIRKETGVNITLRGIGSLYIDPNTGTESQEPLHFYIEHQRFENLNSAKHLAKNLIETLQQEFLQFQQQQSPALPQINIPPPSIISVPPPSIIQSNVPQPQAQSANIIHQQFVTQSGIPIQMQQGNVVIQQQQPGQHNLNIPPPMKQIVQFHQPPPTLQTSNAALQTSQATAASPIILNHQPQASIQYQYIQQPARDGQGNQLTLQQVYQQPQQIQGIQMQATLPPPNLQQQQQYITVQGNTAYMVPPPTIIQQAGAQPTQLSIIQHPPPLHMQLPAGSITVQTPITEAMQQLDQSQMRADLAADNEDYSSAEKSEENDQQSPEEDNSPPTSESEGAALVRTLTTSIPPPQQQLMRQPPPPPMTHVPPPTITMSVPPPMNGVQQHIVGNTLYTTTTTNPGGIQQFQQQVIPLQQQQQTQQFIHTAPNGQNYVMNAATTQWQTRAPQPTQYVTQQITASDLHTLPPPVSMSGIPASVQQSAPVAVTFSQPMMQQQLQLQFQPQMMQQVQMQAQPTTQQFNIIQTQPPPTQALLQQHSQQQQQQQTGMGLLSVTQNGVSYTQTTSTAPPTFIQQQQQQHQLQQQQQHHQQQQQQIRHPPPYGEQGIVRSGQKRKSTSDNTDAPPPIQPRMGMGAQRELADYTIAPPPPPPPPPAPTTSNSNLTSTGGVGIGQDDLTTATVSTSESHQPPSQTHTQTQNQKPVAHHPGYIGMMRYNSEVRRMDSGGSQPPRPPYSSGPPPTPRGRVMYNNSYNNMRPPSQHEVNYRMGFGPPPYRGEGPCQGNNYGPRRLQRQ